ncbi:hypothetical protein CI102_9702 [Trichoderma harzianum]|uniref:Uncharacterized protein n=1 Tax=Trichoderma harzianum CBS 226.95 TaxID=983964 RepID=A0A2T4A090_TRIHA|nr:hypothetical protein M431DRAFT_512035 [Trichoderma harzianum CBS 226.95]PKK45852.1 hypothetical protein CI102_9702 [Trichoderma harzianum]PTB50469.1 hypothetical protein M431DRAFT_512035 [Trichoderma harzianum CBS 226.95]
MVCFPIVETFPHVCPPDCCRTKHVLLKDSWRDEIWLGSDTSAPQSSSTALARSYPGQAHQGPERRIQIKRRFGQNTKSQQKALSIQPLAPGPEMTRPNVRGGSETCKNPLSDTISETCVKRVAVFDQNVTARCAVNSVCSPFPRGWANWAKGG